MLTLSDVQPSHVHSIACTDKSQKYTEVGTCRSKGLVKCHGKFDHLTIYLVTNLISVQHCDVQLFCLTPRALPVIQFSESWGGMANQLT